VVEERVNISRGQTLKKAEDKNARWCRKGGKNSKEVGRGKKEGKKEIWRIDGCLGGMGLVQSMRGAGVGWEE